jgi:serine/threonine-protein kinase
MFSVLTGQISRIDVLSLRTKHVTTLIPSGVRCRYLPTGHLIYESQGHLRAIGFDPERLQTRGSARLVIDDVGQAEGIWGIADYDVSETGNLVCMPTWLDTLVWKDRQGSAVPLKINPRRYGGSPALSPDGRSLAVVVKEGPARHLWFGSVDGEPLTRLTFDSDNTSNLFMPTGKAVLFSSMQGGRYNIFRVPTNMPGKIERLTDGPSSQKPTSISPLGNVLLFNESDETGGIHISHMEIGKPGTARPFVKSRFHEFEGVFSPDGRWVAYQSDESGRYEVYVRPYGGSGERRQVSVDGGIAPAWNPRGGELFYQTPTALMARRVENGIPVSEPTRLFWQRWHGFNAREYDVSGDGQRFLMYEPAGDPSSRLNLVLNWLEELKRLVPTGKK